MEYQKGTSLAFSMICQSPYEGFKMSIHCERGKIEAEEFRTFYRDDEPDAFIRVFRNGEPARVVAVPKKEPVIELNNAIEKYTLMGHGGGDVHLRNLLFVEGTRDDYCRMADSRAGAMSALIGIAGYRSIERHQPILIEDLLK